MEDPIIWSSLYFLLLTNVLQVRDPASLQDKSHQPYSRLLYVSTGFNMLCFQTGKCQTLAWTKNQPTNKLFKRITQFRLSLHGTWGNLSHHLWNPSLLKPNLSVQPWSLKAPALARWMPQPVCTRDGVFGMSPMPPSSRSHMEKQTPNDLSTRHTAPAYHFVLGPALFDQLRHRLLDQALQGFASIISAFVELNNNSFS